MASRDRLRRALWSLGIAGVVVAATLEPHRLLTALWSTGDPFLTLALVILAGAVCDRLGAFRTLARWLLRDAASARVSFGAVLAFTALVSGVVNLDVAVVVAMPVALRVAQRKRLNAAWLTVAVAITANATSFLFPTSNLTTLLVLNRSPLPVWRYLGESVAAWGAVTVVTVVGLALILGRVSDSAAGLVERQASLGSVFDLAPMYLAASAIRALLGGLVLHGGFVKQVGLGALLAAGVNNLPASAAIHVRPSARWAAILAMAIGPNLLLTGSVATLICRRIARDADVQLKVLAFSLVGVLVVPLQILVAAAALQAAGVRL